MVADVVIWACALRARPIPIKPFLISSHRIFLFLAPAGNGSIISGRRHQCGFFQDPLLRGAYFFQLGDVSHFRRAKGVQFDIRVQRFPVDEKAST